MLPFRYPDKPITTSPEHVSSLNKIEWLAQCKYDGWRLCIFFDAPNKIRFLSRAGNNIAKNTPLPPTVIEQINTLELPNDTVLDAELVGPRGGHKTQICVFDCLALDRKWLPSLAYRSRWDNCLEIFKDAQLPDIHLATTIYADGTGIDFDNGTPKQFQVDSENPFLSYFEMLKKYWLIAQNLDLYEGLVIKRLDGTLNLKLTSCAESGSMMKIKYRDIRERRY